MNEDTVRSQLLIIRKDEAANNELIKKCKDLSTWKIILNIIWYILFRVFLYYKRFNFSSIVLLKLNIEICIRDWTIKIIVDYRSLMYQFLNILTLIKFFSILYIFDKTFRMLRKRKSFTSTSEHRNGGGLIIVLKKILFLFFKFQIDTFN